VSRLFEDVVRRVQIPVEIADWIAEALRESQDDKGRFHRTAVMQLQQQYLSVQSKLDRAYEDRLAGKVTDELWARKSRAWEEELEAIRRETVRHEKASHDYSVTGAKILELAKNAHNLGHSAEFAGAGTTAQNTAFELHIRPRNSFSHPTVSRLTCSLRATQVEIGWEAGIRTRSKPVF
jgi:hypothetical protein